ncbi:hypothetical protein [Paraburkholderia sp. 32]|uniref:hypothetical protein n=1 Tax=Paraburkholderia sp. 32 TaxID=2991057 RepID=UPI003D1E4559
MIELNIPDEVDHGNADKPSKRVVDYSRTQAKSRAATKVDADGDVHIVLPAGKRYPFDWCEKYASLLVNPVNRQLRYEYLEMNIDDFLVLLERTYGPSYAVAYTWFVKARTAKNKPSKYPHTIAKLIAVLNSRGVTVPPITAKDISFNQMRTHLLGKGKAQEFTVMQIPGITLGKRFVRISGKTFHWFNAMGLECEVDCAAGIAHHGRTGRSMLVMSDFLALIGMDRNELERRCMGAPE